MLAEDGDSERAADLAGEVVDGRGDALTVRGKRWGDRRRCRRRGKADAKTGDQCGESEVPVRGVGGEGREDEEAGAHHGQSHAAGDAHAEAARERRRARREQHQHERHRQQRGAGLERRVTEHELQYWRATKSSPNWAKNCRVSESDPTQKPRRANRRGSSIGSFRQSS
jgi:hypothetical protein